MEDLQGKNKKSEYSTESSIVALNFLFQLAQLSWEAMPSPLLKALRDWILYSSDFNSLH